MLVKINYKIMKILRTLVSVTYNKPSGIMGTLNGVLECHLGNKVLLPNGGVLTHYTYYDSSGAIVKMGESNTNQIDLESLFDLVKGNMPDINLGYTDYNNMLYLEGSKHVMVNTFIELSSITEVEIVDISQSFVTQNQENIV